jgi:hypothetical protein
MTDQPLDDNTLDTEGHGTRYTGANAESAEGDDSEAHSLRFGRSADAESAERDDTGGHGGHLPLTQDPDDTEGHGLGHS